MKKTILCIVGSMNVGGAETFLMKIFRTIDKSKFIMDFCVTTNEEGFYDNEIISNGGTIYKIVSKKKNPIKNFFQIKKIVNQHKYENVIRVSHHSLSSIDLLAAKMGGAKKCLLRSSNSNSCGNFLNRFLHNFFMPLAIAIPNIKVAPSDKAAIHMFGKRNYEKGMVHILNNGLKIDDFKFNYEIRERKRKELNLEDECMVIGHVGRMMKQKNHKYLIDIFCKYLDLNNNAKLLLVGDGELKQEIIAYANSKNIIDKIIILGVRSDTNELYQAMDCFVFPSLFEGMPNTVIEAQTSGLKCVVSDTITLKVDLTGNVQFCELEKIDKWVDSISKLDDIQRKKAYIAVNKSGYSIEDVSKKFINLFKL